MILTEKEAKLKKCCIDIELCLCCASDCMAWRWVEGYQPYNSEETVKKGYCGLAGEP